MNEEKQKPVSKRTKKTPEAQIIEPDTGHIINQATINILVQQQKATPEQIEALMKAELNYNRERLSITREHSEKDPDLRDERKQRAFRRSHYYFLMALLVPLIYILPNQNISISAMLGSMIFFIIVSLAMNGRDRENDSAVLVALIDKLLGKQHD